ncbi:hypothetical protein RSP795_10175 [Ralstonia solanacearum]|uniref:hypothetical protein n=1 Tax=Ralstonia solanacearum TaxID=305 RepID=UPI0007D7E21E|nr:hypothetical protein [Ralstonia solanacearum]OAI62798.1 hypothetical protein RSP795_10175 [Ralstonia solanacearum]
MSETATPKKATLWVLNGQVSAVSLPGEPGPFPGVATVEVDIEDAVGVGSPWPPEKPAAKVKGKAA